MRTERSKTTSDAKTTIVEVPMRGPTYHPGARLLAVLAHPPASETDTRWRLAERALCRLVWLAHEVDRPAMLREPQTLIPEHLTLSPSKAHAEEKLLRQKLHHRMGAAHVAIPYFLEALRAEQTPAARRMTDSIDHRILTTLEQEQDRRTKLAERGAHEKPRFPFQADNFDSRALRPSLPVLHLAVATALAIDFSRRQAADNPEDAATLGLTEDVGGPQFSAMHILAVPGLARSIMEHATALEGVTQRLTVLRPRRLVRLIAA